jgi:hypothetical protein
MSPHAVTVAALWGSLAAYGCDSSVVTTEKKVPAAVPDEDLAIPHSADGTSPLSSEVVRQGLKAWRTPHPNGACASCHTADAYDLAFFDYDDATIMRRGIGQGATVEDVHAIVAMVHYWRERDSIKPVDPRKYRFLQPGGAVLPGQTMAHKDLNLFNELRSNGLLMYQDEKIRTLEQAQKAVQQLLDLRTVRVGLPFNHWTADAIRGEEFRTLQKWIPEIPRQPKPEYAQQWYQLQNQYIENPRWRNWICSGVQEAMTETKSLWRVVAFFCSLVIAACSSEAVTTDDKDSGGGAGGTPSTSSGGRSPDATPNPMAKPEPQVVLTSFRKDCGLAGAPLGQPTEIPPCKEHTVAGFEYKFCVKAHPTCLSGDGRCPVYVTGGIGDSYFDRVEHPERYGNLMVVKLDPVAWQMQNASERIYMAGVIREVRSAYPGQDPDRWYFVAFSNSTDTIAALHVGSEGPTSREIDGAFAGFVKMGYCGGLKEIVPASYPAHELVMTGADDDVHARDGRCVELDPGKPDRHKNRAIVNGCDETRQVTPVGADEPYFGGADGSDIVLKGTFANCKHADFLHYRFLDEGHRRDFKKHFEPPLSGTDIAWNFLQGRTRPGANGLRGLGSACSGGLSEGEVAGAGGAGGNNL